MSKKALLKLKSKIDRFNEISELMADPDADFDALMEEMGHLQTEIDAADAWDLDSELYGCLEMSTCRYSSKIFIRW